MLLDETLANLQTALALMSESDPRLHAHLHPVPEGEEDGCPNDDTADELAAARAWCPPVVGSPQWFLDEVREAYGQGRTDYEVDELCGLKVVQRDELSEPILVLADGRWYNILPDWARRTAERIEAEDTRRRLTAGTQTHGA